MMETVIFTVGLSAIFISGYLLYEIKEFKKKLKIIQTENEEFNRITTDDQNRSRG